MPCSFLPWSYLLSLRSWCCCRSFRDTEHVCTRCRRVSTNSVLAVGGAFLLLLMTTLFPCPRPPPRPMLVSVGHGRFSGCTHFPKVREITPAAQTSMAALPGESLMVVHLMVDAAVLPCATYATSERARTGSIQAFKLQRIVLLFAGQSKG